MSFRIVWRKSVNVVMLSLTGLCALFTVSVLFFILGYLLWYGGKSLNWAFLHQTAGARGRNGRRDGQCHCGQRQASAAGFPDWASPSACWEECTWRNSAAGPFLFLCATPRTC